MEKRRTSLRSFAQATVVGLLLAAAIVSAWFEFTPVASIADTRAAALIFALAAALLALPKVLRPLPSLARGAWIAASATALAVALFALVLLFGMYGEEEVRFRSGELVLAGTLFLPEEAGPHPAVVFIHGSGRAERREFGWHAKFLARHGIAALIYDKRGSGESGGNTFETGYDGYAADAAAAIDALRSRTDIRSECIGIAGHSEGGWVASIVASGLAPEVAFVIVTSTTDLSPARQVLYETGSSMRAADFPPDAVRRATDLQRRVLASQRSGTADPALEQELAAAAAEPWFSTAELPDRLYPPDEYAWWRSVMDFDPFAHWRGVRAPVLAISGGLDLNSDVRASQAAIRQALRSGGNEDFTGVVFPRMEHGGIEWWLPGRIPPPRFPEGYPELLLEWTRRKTDACG
ncbi:MAG TPA: alpha/beta hydrolase [Thermoanaerobaculia bacterium]|nr:alpha/beta hydrolase [Thermoanaerobaculia bacterium]